MHLILLAALLVPQAQHVVVVVLDDVGLDKVACYGAHPTAGPTPVLDDLAATGLRFTQAYAHPRCSPSRASMLTGRYPSRTGIGCPVPVYDPATDPNGPFLPSADEPWLPSLLPVRSYLVGKWHLTHIDAPDYHLDPIAKGFTRWRGHLVNPMPGQMEGVYSWTKQKANGKGWSEKPSSLFIMADNANEAWNALHASRGQRSLVWLALQAAHQPWTDPPPLGLYTPEGGVQNGPKLEQYALEAGDTLLGQLMAFYATHLPVDAAQTTWVIMGDNGTATAAIEAPWAKEHGKGTVYQGGVHVPLIAWGYGVVPGVTDAVVDATDIWATVLDLFCVPQPPGQTDSLSFAAVLSGGAGQREWAYVRHHLPNGFGPYTELDEAATDGHWKLIQRLDGSHELYDLDADPLEVADLWPPDPGIEATMAAAAQAVIDAANAP